MGHQRPLALFVALTIALSSLVFGQTSPSPSAPANTGVEGVITISPAHGGPVREGQPNSVPLAKTTFVVRQEDQVATSFTTDEQGRFKISLPPGRYVVEKGEPRTRIGNYGPFSVNVVAGEMTKVEWNCDSGMR